jgi:hypothetical protein
VETNPPAQLLGSTDIAVGTCKALQVMTLDIQYEQSENSNVNACFCNTNVHPHNVGRTLLPVQPHDVVGVKLDVTRPKLMSSR